ncbi:MAG: glycine dehydrogenase (aminomethyl-transferring), partial [Puniceicoccaceae bacterium]|nr:glycine dehydrogenase (aminomethyl-transferring) [Puniceicoccaceae bacterium]
MIEFIYRHIGPTDDSIQAMLDYLGYDSLDAFTDAIVPENIQIEQALKVPDALSESESSQRLMGIAQKNQVFHSLIGQGFYGTVTPPVIRRNILENPAWYSGYTPYQAEISQGRLEALFNFQTMVSDLTGFPIANASLLDEPTAVAEAIMLCHRAQKSRGSEVFLSDNCHPQTLSICRARAELLGWTVVVGDWSEYEPSEDSFAAVIQYPETDGGLHNFTEFTERMHKDGVLVVAATDLLALTLFTEPASWDADVAVGSTQRFGCPVGFGGPHAAFFATKEVYKRLIPGRIVGRSVDSSGNDALRLALQTREQHIRREKATSNICTAQVLPAVMASMYALYHGANNLRAMAESVHAITNYLARRLSESGYALFRRQSGDARFDTLRIELSPDCLVTLRQRALKEGINLRYYSDTELGFSIDETVDYPLLEALARIFDFELDS